VAILFLLFAGTAHAQSVAVTLSSNDNHEGFAHLENRFDFTVKVVNVQVTFSDPSGQERRFDNATPLDVNLPPGGEADVAISLAGGEGFRLQDASRITVAAGVEIDPIAAPAEAAIASGDETALREALPLLDRYIPTVSLGARLHADALARIPEVREAYFDLERLDGLKAQIEGRICENASQRILAANDRARMTIYEELGESLREIGLHVNCMNAEAKLAMARTLIAGDRPQDALLFRETDDDGNLLPEWRPIILEASLAFANKAVELGASQFNTLRPALESLNQAHELAPEDPRVTAVADALVPAVGRWAVRATDAMGRDLDGVQAALRLLRPTWDRYPAVMEAGNALAAILIESGNTYCEARQFTNARNEFIRGERILDGIEAWEANSDEINHCRALGALEEGRETAAIYTDINAPRRGFEKLEEALSRYDLSEEEVNAFKADISSAWVAVAQGQLEERSWNAARAALQEAIDVSPTGTTDEIREGYVSYVETVVDSKGYFMSGLEVDDAREALARAEGLDPARISGLESRLTMAFWGIRAGIPVLGLVFALIALAYMMASKAKARKMAAMVDDDLL
jgi:hypothetical protein